MFRCLGEGALSGTGYHVKKKRRNLETDFKILCIRVSLVHDISFIITTFLLRILKFCCLTELLHWLYSLWSSSSLQCYIRRFHYPSRGLVGPLYVKIRAVMFSSSHTSGPKWNASLVIVDDITGEHTNFFTF